MQECRRSLVPHLQHLSAISKVARRKTEKGGVGVKEGKRQGVSGGPFEDNYCLVQIQLPSVCKRSELSARL